jgi:hypothetical protein
MNALEIYIPPFRADGAFIYSSNGVMALMAADCKNYPEKLMERTCQILNDEVQSNGNTNIGYSNGEIYNRGELLMVVRGFRHLTDVNGLNLSTEAALNMQDEFLRWVVHKLQNQ